MKKLCLSLLILCFVLCGLSCEKSREGKITKASERIEKKSQSAIVEKDKGPTLNLVPISDNTVGIDLTNSVSVKGLQFTITGAKINQASITSRTQEFLVEFNKDNGKVILLSFSGKTIAPGTGTIAKIICDGGGSASITDIKIAQ